VPSTEKCSSDSSGATSLCASTAASSLRAISVLSSRSRFFVNTVATHTGSSMPSPTNQRNSRLYCIWSISCRSERTENRICTSAARSSRSGAIEGRPSGAYSWPNSLSSAFSASLTIAASLRSGCRAGMRSSRLTYENRDPFRSSTPRIADPPSSIGKENHASLQPVEPGFSAAC
jgi:hypothetical protein